MKLFHKKNQHGFSALAVLLVVAVLAIVGLVGYRVVNKTTNNDTGSTVTTQATVPSKIQNKGDVQQASKALDGQNVDKDLDSSQFNADISAL